MRIDLCLDEGAVAEIAHEVRGCLLCEAAASVIGAHATGIAVVDLRRLDRRLRRHLGGEEIAFEAPWDALRMFDPVRGYRSRHECVLLPFDALGRALAGAEEAQSAGKAT